MASRRTPANPFYILLVAVGILFVLTACAYTLMATVAVRDASDPSVGATVPPTADSSAEQAHPAKRSPAGEALLAFLDRWGVTLLIGELVLLGVATVGAIGTDDYWTRRAARQAQSSGGDA